MSRKDKLFDMVIIGGGASGMMAAVTAGRDGRSVLLLEQKEAPGKKILATGNGKCNFTNADMDLSHFHGDKELISFVYENFDRDKTLAFFRSLGVYPKNKKGYYYPMSEQASSVNRALVREMERVGVTLVCGEKASEIRKKKEVFFVRTETNTYCGRKLVIATGLQAAPKLGSDGNLFAAIKSLGHRMVKPLPALCGFYAAGLSFKKLAGVRVESRLTLYVNNEKMAEDLGELQLTDYGISGIPVFQISSPASRALDQGAACLVELECLPSLGNQDLAEELKRRYESGKNYQDTAEALLLGLLPDKLAQVLMEASGINPRDCMTQLPERKVGILAEKIKAARVTLKKPRDFEFAQVCTGGLPAEEVNPRTLESRRIPGLFFCGEILDVDGICGGYNLQWAWSSGYTAAKGRL